MKIKHGFKIVLTRILSDDQTATEKEGFEASAVVRVATGTRRGVLFVPVTVDLPPEADMFLARRMLEDAAIEAAENALSHRPPNEKVALRRMKRGIFY